jgi:hypothetical protein
MTPDQLKLLADIEFDRAVYKRNLRETAQAQLIVPFAGGLFVASPMLIAFLSATAEDIVYLEDSYNNPIQADRAELLSLLKVAYTDAMSNWYEELQKSNRIRRANNV